MQARSHFPQFTQLSARTITNLGTGDTLLGMDAQAFFLGAPAEVESRYAQATKQMLETDDYIAIRFQTEARNKKPVGIYWMQAAVVSAAEAAAEAAWSCAWAASGETARVAAHAMAANMADRREIMELAPTQKVLNSG